MIDNDFFEVAKSAANPWVLECGPNGEPVRITGIRNKDGREILADIFAALMKWSEGRSVVVGPGRVLRLERQTEPEWPVDSELWKQACFAAGVDHTVEHHVALAALGARVKAVEGRPVLDIEALQRLAVLLGYETGDLIPNLMVLVNDVQRRFERNDQQRQAVREGLIEIMAHI
jgi:hypothetical protein